MRWLTSAIVAVAATAIHSVDATLPSAVKLEGINYDTQRCKSFEVESANLDAIAKIAKSIRLYSVGAPAECPDNLKRLLDMAKAKGLKVSLGMWLGAKPELDPLQNSEIKKLKDLLAAKKIDSNIIGFHVGSEGIYRKDYSADTVIQYVNAARKLFTEYGVSMRLTVADVIDSYYNNPQLIDAVDYISINQFSFWEGNGFDPNAAMQKMLDRMRKIRVQAASKNKQLLISETGWASGGVDPSFSSGVASMENQRAFFTNFYHQITAQRIPYYWFVALDAPWNHESNKTVEQHFGVLDFNTRQVKVSYAGADLTSRAITTVQSSRGVLAETYNANAPDVVDGVELSQPSTDLVGRFRSQWFWRSDKNQLRSLNSDRCLDAYQPQDGGIVHTYACSETNGNQKWRYDAATQQFQHAVHTGFCLEDRVDTGKIQLWKCSATNGNQRWSLVAPPQLTCPVLDTGVDYTGNDVGSEKSARADGCCALCVANAFCNAFTWTNHDGGTCWLKSGKGETTVNFGTSVSAQLTLAPPTSTTAPPPVTTTPTTTTPTTTTPTTTTPTTTTPTTTQPVTPPPPSECSALEPNVDYLENDVGNARSKEAGGCCAICTRTSGCKAFTWSDHDGGTCWLKSGKGKTATKANVFSGVIASTPTTTAPPTPPPSQCSVLQVGVDYLGNDVANKLSKKPDDCCAICKTTSGCKAFTWSDYNGGTCWLKSGKGQTAPKANVFSGVINDDVTPPPTTTKPPVTTAPPTTTTPPVTTAPPTTTTPPVTTAPPTTTKPPTTTAPPTPAPSTCPTIEEGVDYVGLDVASAPSTTAEGCCVICRSNANCNAFSWTNHNGGTCWLKTTKGETTSKAGTRSAVIRPACSDIEENIDYTGFDLVSKPSVAAVKAELCCGICKTTSGCKAYTWTNYNGGTCWLKSGRGARATKTGARSASVL